MKRNQWSAVLFAVLLFSCGAAVGALGHRYYNASVVSAKAPADDFRHRYVAEMQSKLRLTAIQTSQLEAILDDTKAKFKAVHESYRPAMQKIKQEQVTRVKSILTPAQILGYEQLRAEHERQQHHD